MTFLELIPIGRFIWSFCILSYDRPIASSKTSSPQSAILPFIFQFPVLSPFPKVIQQFLTSSSSPPLHFYLSFYILFNNVFYAAAPTQDVAIPVSLHSFYCR